MMVDYLNNCGYSVVEAASAEEAQAALERGVRVDLVFSDVVIPGKSGFDLASWIRGHQPNMPILLTSGYADIARRTANTPYAGRVLEKPYLPDEVVEIIETMLHRV
jgi:DNA-binding NtrC family response regulator